MTNQEAPDGQDVQAEEVAGGGPDDGLDEEEQSGGNGDEQNNGDGPDNQDEGDSAVPESAAPHVYQVPERHDSVYDLCPLDPSRMELTEQERQWALAMKELVESDPELDNLADFDYAQLAIIDHEDVEQALERVRHFQIFREEYKLANTPDEWKRVIRNFVGLQPEALLSVCYHRDEGTYVIVVDSARFYEENLKTEQDYHTMMGFAYFVCHVTTPDFTAIRQGTFVVIETMDYDWRNYSMKTRQRLWTEIWGLYPVIIRQLKYFHTGLFASLGAALAKKFVGEEISSRFQVGCQFAGRLDTFYAVPTREIANQRLIERFDALLERRYENIQKFKL